VDARDRLRQYLEQRKELGERDLVLDGLSVEDLLKVLGAPKGADSPFDSSARPSARPSRSDRAAPPTGERREEAPPSESPRYAFPGKHGLRAPDPPAAASPSPRVGDGPADRSPPAAPAAPASGAITVGGSVASATAGSFASKLDSLDALAEAVAACKLCGLHATAKRAVPGEGSAAAKFVCVGEAPGATEDETGRPFVGAAGQLLTKILEAIEFKREDVFICNVLKHRPPGNRNPEPDEITACSPYLLQQLALLKPRVILALGTFAAQTLLQTSLPISKLRGQIHRYHGVPLVVTYHPAALLRNSNWKRPTWEDVQLARRIFDNASGAA